MDKEASTVPNINHITEAERFSRGIISRFSHAQVNEMVNIICNKIVLHREKEISEMEEKLFTVRESLRSLYLNTLRKE